MSTTLAAIRQILNESDISFREIHHEPTRTSEDSARVRGEELHTGGKALLLKVDTTFSLFVLPADCRSHSGSIRRALGARKLRFATAEELMDQTGLVPGSVPPFGRPILPFELYVDRGTAENERIAFNAGSLTDSIIMSVDDYLRIASPAEIFDFAMPPDQS